MERHFRSQPGQSRRAVIAALVGISVTGCTAQADPDDGDADSPDTSTGTVADGTDTENSTNDDGSPAPDTWEPADGLPTGASVEETTVVSGLEIPWDITFAGDDAFFTERESGVRRVDAEALASEHDLAPEDTELVASERDLPNYETINYSGFLGVAAHPEYPDSPHIYLYHSYDDGDPQNQVIR